MEQRVLRFYELHSNKWFHIMNFSLDVLRTPKKERYMLIQHGAWFYHNMYNDAICSRVYKN